MTAVESPCKMCEEREKAWHRSFLLDVQRAVVLEDSRALKALSVSPDFKTLLLTTDANGWTILHKAVGQQLEKAVDVLLQHGALPNKVNHSGQTAVHVACSTGNGKVIRSLIAAGGSVSVPVDRLGHRPLDYGPMTVNGKLPFIQKSTVEDQDSLRSGSDVLTLSVPILEPRRNKTYSSLQKDRLGRYHSKDSLVEREKPNKENPDGGKRQPSKDQSRRPLQLWKSNALSGRPAKRSNKARTDSESDGHENAALQASNSTRFNLHPRKGLQQIFNTIRSRRSPNSFETIRGDDSHVMAPGVDGEQHASHSSSLQRMDSDLLPAIAEGLEHAPSHTSDHSDKQSSLQERPFIPFTVKDRPSSGRLSHNKGFRNLPDLVEECSPDNTDGDSGHLSYSSGLLMKVTDHTDASTGSEREGEQTKISGLEDASTIVEPGSNLRVESDCSEMLEWVRPVCEDVEEAQNAPEDTMETRAINVERMFGPSTPRRCSAPASSKQGFSETRRRIANRRSESKLDHVTASDIDPLQELLREAKLF